MNTFKSLVNLIDQRHLKSHDIDEEEQQVEIKWTLELNLRSWGIKDFIVDIPEQTISVKICVWDEEGDDFKIVEEDVVLKNVKIKLHFLRHLEEKEVPHSIFGSLEPVDLVLEEDGSFIIIF